MADVRYPVGRFEFPAPVTPGQRREWIGQIADLPRTLRTTVEGLSDEQLDTPYREGGWTVRQVVHHLADSHLNAYIRFRLGLTEEQPVVKPYDEGAWAQLPDARTAPVAVSLSVLEGIHDRWVRLLETMDEAALTRTIRHPESGVMTMEFLLGMYAWHGRHHTAHIAGLRQQRDW